MIPMLIKALTLSEKDSKSEKRQLQLPAPLSTGCYAEYHVNPANANVNELKDKLSFMVKPNVDYISSRAAASNDFAMTPEFVSFYGRYF